MQMPDVTGVVAGVADYERESVAALDAVTDKVEVLTDQVEWLKLELSDAVTRMERSSEDRERIGAEKVFFAKNYGGLKRWSEEEGSADAVTNAATRASVKEVELSSNEDLVESFSNDNLVEPSSNDDLVKSSSNLESAVPSSEIKCCTPQN